MLIEMIGYLGSMLVVVSMLMTSVKKLRIINTLGCVIFTVYALIIHSYPTAAMNAALIIINVCNIKKLSKTKNRFSHLKACNDDSFVRYFVDRYRNDISVYFPDFDPDRAANTVYMVCRETTPAGLLVGNAADDGTLEIYLDYSTPAYRDCSVGTYLYMVLRDAGFKELIFKGNSEKHSAYMKKMGYEEMADAYRKKLA